MGRHDGDKRSAERFKGPQLLVPKDEDTDATTTEMSDKNSTLTADWDDKDRPAPRTLVWKGTMEEERLPPGKNISRLPTVNFATPSARAPISFARSFGLRCQFSSPKQLKNMKHTW
jgi:hypothetical protein